MVQWSLQFNNDDDASDDDDAIELVFMLFEWFEIIVVELSEPIFALSNHEITRCGMNCGIGTPNTFFVWFMTSVVSLGNWSKFKRNADTGDKSFIVFVSPPLPTIPRIKLKWPIILHFMYHNAGEKTEDKNNYETAAKWNKFDFLEIIDHTKILMQVRTGTTQKTFCTI